MVGINIESLELIGGFQSVTSQDYGYLFHHIDIGIRSIR